jgi:hypothetical protein
LCALNVFFTHASETWILTKGDRKQMNVFERKMYRRILGPAYEKKIGGYSLIKKFMQLLKNLL